VADPRAHIIIVRKKDSSESGQYSVATILVCRRPFTNEEIDRISAVSNEMNFLPVLTPRFALLPEFQAVATSSEYEQLISTYPLNIEAPTDDTPFFFHMLRATDLFKASTYQGMNDINLKAVKVLGALLAIVSALSVGAIVLPLALQQRVRQRLSPYLMVYFAAIGLAFMMVEIGQLERLIVFLGHPIYGLTVVLFVLLVGSSLGSLCSSQAGRWIWALPLILLGFIWGGPIITRQFIGASTSVRILVSALMLFPCGFFMGTAFPVGLKQAALTTDSPKAWYWTINGAFSVISSVLALAIAVFWGVTATLFVGLVTYLLALLALLVDRTRKTTVRGEEPIHA
jgi:hypothetical protein